MTLRWKLVCAILGAIIVTGVIELAASHAINVKVSAYATESWLSSAVPEGVVAVVNAEFELLEEAALLLPATLDEGAAAGLQSFDADDGRFWIIMGKGGLRHASPRNCDAVPPFAPAPASRPVRSALLCAGVPALIVSRRIDDEHLLVLGRYVDGAFARRLASATSAEVALFGPSGLVASSSETSAGGPLELRFADGENVELTAPHMFATQTFIAPGYGGYTRRGSSIAAPIGAVDDDTPFRAYAFLSPMPGAEALPVRLMLWVPTALMASTPLVGLVAAGTALCLPILIAFVWLFAGRIARPITALAAAARRVTDGDLDVKAPPRLAGELGDLARAFDQMVASLQDAQRRALVSEKMAAVGQLAGGVAHEINNPLGVILGFAQGLERRMKSPTPPSTASFTAPVEAIVREALRCRALVQELLVFAKNDTRNFERIELAAVVKSSLQLLAARARTQNVAVVFDVDDRDALVMQANTSQLAQVIVNLGANALDVMPHRGSLTVSLKRDVGYDVVGRAVLEMRDTGPGIDDAIRTRIFDPFFTTKDVGKGTGLGLSLVHEIVKQHGGAIGFDSSPQTGTTFRVVLPLDAGLRAVPR